LHNIFLDATISLVLPSLTTTYFSNLFMQARLQLPISAEEVNREEGKHNYRN
jgi:hypothetical protein